MEVTKYVNGKAETMTLDIELKEKEFWQINAMLAERRIRKTEEVRDER